MTDPHDEPGEGDGPGDTGDTGGDRDVETQRLPENAAVVQAADHWFIRHGLPYFVPEERAAARTALRSRRTLTMLALTVLVALAVGVVLAVLRGDPALAPALPMTIAGVAVVWFAATTLRARPIGSWAVSRTLRSLRLIFPLVTRALPLLLLFVTFLFINAEVWEVSARLDGAVLWVTVMLFAAFAVCFLLVRLPEELEHVDSLGDETRLVDACRNTPLESTAPRLVEELGRERLVHAAEVHSYERANLLLVLVIAQAVQVLLLAVAVFLFFLLFGAIVMDEQIQANWTGVKEISHVPGLAHVSPELMQVSVFLAAFSGLYFAVYAVTDEAYRDQFFTQVKRDLERAVAVRAVYLALRGGGVPDAAATDRAGSDGAGTDDPRT